MKNKASAAPVQQDYPSEYPGDPVLYLSADHPDEIDEIAEIEVKKLYPKVTIQRVRDYTEISTPRLAVGRSFYRGVNAIRAYIEQKKLQDEISQHA